MQDLVESNLDSLANLISGLKIPQNQLEKHLKSCEKKEGAAVNEKNPKKAVKLEEKKESKLAKKKKHLHINTMRSEEAVLEDSKKDLKMKTTVSNYNSTHPDNNTMRFLTPQNMTAIVNKFGFKKPVTPKPTHKLSHSIVEFISTSENTIAPKPIRNENKLK